MGLSLKIGHEVWEEVVFADEELREVQRTTPLEGELLTGRRDALRGRDAPGDRREGL